MQSIVAITGIGLVTPLGDSAPATWDALLAGRYIENHARIEICSTGILPVSSNSKKDTGRMPVLQQREPRVCGLANRAANEAVVDAKWSNHAGSRTALVVGTSKGPIESWIAGGGVSEGLAAVARSIMSSLPQIRFNSALTLSAACASGLHALIRGTMMLHSGEADRVLVVAAEASVHPLFLASFQRLGVLARPSVGCRPFDRDREGFLMSEAAAAVCLERVDSTDAYCFIEKIALGGDSTNLIASDPHAMTLKRVLRDVIPDSLIDLIHAHGTGTVVNDAIELKAIEAAGCGGGIMYSHKGALGHSLGAAGLVAVVINAMAHRHGTVPGNVRTHRPMESRGVKLSQFVQCRSVRRSVAIASGFGGAVAAVELRSGNAAYKQ